MRNQEEGREGDKIYFNKMIKNLFLSMLNFVCVHVQQENDACSLKTRLYLLHLSLSQRPSFHLIAHSFFHLPAAILRTMCKTDSDDLGKVTRPQFLQ